MVVLYFRPGKGLYENYVSSLMTKWMFVMQVNCELRTTKVNALQLLKRIESFVLKVHLTIFVDVTVHIGILFQCHYLRNWILKNVRKISETLMEQRVLN